MKAIKIFKANGHTFNTFEEVEKYAKENGYIITTTETVRIKGKLVNFIGLTSKNKRNSLQGSGWRAIKAPVTCK